jgi:ankyrin repeat protein
MGADVNLPDEDGDYPIQMANEAGYFKDVVQILLDCGAKDLRSTPSKKKTDMDDYYLERERLNTLTGVYRIAQLLERKPCKFSMLHSENS